MFNHGSDISKIIKACHENGVKLFKQGDIEIHFGAVAQPELVQADPPVVETLTTPQPMEVDSEFIKEQEAMLREQYIAELMITDPALYEQILSEGQENAESI